jgi:hypothetical protein
MEGLLLLDQQLHASRWHHVYNTAIRVSWRFESQKVSVGDPLRNQATSGSNGLICMLGMPTAFVGGSRFIVNL